MHGEKKAMKVQEFMANSPEVLCCRFSTNEGTSLLATGGSDHRVGVWRCNMACGLANLAGPTSPVTSVAFSPSPGSAETKGVVAGEKNGVLRVWDLKKQKEVRRYSTSCHKAAVTSVDYHPFGEFFVSSSLDGNVKVWDMRKSSCLQTYKYHEGKEAGNRAVCKVQFSPDGRMVASGNADGTVILWDLTMGQRLCMLSQHHKQPITSLDFHPLEFILAAGCSDGVVSYWNIDPAEDKYAHLSETPPVPGGVDCITFSPSGSGLLLCHEGGVNVCGWGNAPAVYDKVPQKWSKVGDASVTQQQVLQTATFSNSFVSIWSVPLGDLSPFKGLPSTPPAGTASPSATRAHDAKSTPVPQKRQHNQVHIPRSVDDSRDLPIHRVGSAPCMRAVPGPATPVKASPEPSAAFGRSHTGGTQQQSQPQQSGAAAIASPPSFGRRGTTPPSGSAGYHDDRSRHRPKQAAPVHATASTPEQLPSNPLLSAAQEPSTPLESTPPTSCSVPTRLPVTDTEAASLALADSFPLQHILQTRLMHVKVLKSLWATEPRDAVQHLCDVYGDDPTTAVDFLSTLSQSKVKRALTLDLSCMLVPIICELLKDDFEGYHATSVRAARIIFAMFGGPMGRVLRQGAADDGRLAKYKKLSDAYAAMRPRLKMAAQHSKLVGDDAAQLLRELDTL